MCGCDFSVAHGGENYINRHKNTSKHKGYVDAAQQKEKKAASFGTTLVTADLNQKVVKVEILFPVFFG